MEVFNEFLALQAKLLALESVQEYLSDLQVGTFDSPDLNVRTIEESLYADAGFLRLSFNNVTAHLMELNERAEPPPTTFKSNDFMGLLSLLLLEEDSKSPYDSGVLQVLSTILQFAKLRSNEDLFSGDRIAIGTYTKCMRQLVARCRSRYEIPRELLWELDGFLTMQNIGFESIQETIDFLLASCMRHFDMIQTLSIYDKTCSPGFLSFVCLGTLITKRYSTYPTMRQDVILYFFNCVDICLNGSSELTEVQTGILHSNFRSLVRQVGPVLEADSNSVILALAQIGKHYSGSKVLVLMINQLPFAMYEKFVVLLTRMNKLSYDANRQKFCFNLLEHPIIDVDEKRRELHHQLVMRLIDTILWPLSTNDGNGKPAENALMYFYRMLQTGDKELLTVLTKMMSEDDSNHSEAQLFANIYSRCSDTWVSTSKIFNQYFISIFCSNYKLQDRISIGGFEKFSKLVSSASIADLIPSLPVISDMLHNKLCDDSDMTHLLLKMLVSNALATDSHNLQYLRVLHRLIFTNEEGIRVANIMFNYEFDMTALLKRMVAQELVTNHTINFLSGKLMKSTSYWKLIEIIVSMFPDVTIPSMMMTCFDSMIRNIDFLISPELKTLVSTITKIVELKTQRNFKEQAFLQNYITFLLTNVECRTFPMACINLVLISLRRVMDFIDHDYSALSTVFTKIEETIINKVHSGEDEKMMPLLRDLLYYTEMSVIFGDKPEFQGNSEAISALTKYLEKEFASPPEDYNILEVILKCSTNMCVRNETLLHPTTLHLRSLLRSGDSRSRILALFCLHDIAVIKTHNYEVLLPYIYGFMRSDDAGLQKTGLTVFIDLINNDFFIPNHWQVFSIVSLTARKFIEIERNAVKLHLFLLKNEALMKRYFINILLYFNECYDHPSFKLEPSEVNRIPQQQVPSEKRSAVYFLITQGFSKYALFKVIDQIYTEVIRKLPKLNLPCKKMNDLLHDVYVVTLVALRQHHSEYPRNSKEVYIKTMRKVGKIDSQCTRTNSTDSDFDATLKKIMTSLLKICYEANTKLKNVLPELFHLVLAICEWYYDNLCNIIINDGQDKRFREKLTDISTFFRGNGEFFHPERNMIQGPNVQRFYKI